MIRLDCQSLLLLRHQMTFFRCLLVDRNQSLANGIDTKSTAFLNAWGMVTGLVFTTSRGLCASIVTERGFALMEGAKVSAFHAEVHTFASTNVYVRSVQLAEARQCVHTGAKKLSV
jgi:hypothetical protein